MASNPHQTILESIFCPLIMTAGRPKRVDAGSLYALAHQLYWDFRRLAEGGSRHWFDKKEHQRFIGYLDKHPVQLNEEQKARYKEMVDEEIRNRHLSEREVRLRELENGGLAVTRAWAERIAAEESTRVVEIPGEPDVFQQLMNADTAEQVIEICKDAPNWPTSSLGFLPFHLEQHPEAFIAAKNDPRFPRSSRPTNQLKQFWFLSRAIAGATFGVRTRTAINLVGSKTPDQIFDESRFGKPARKPRKVKRGL